MNINNSRLIFPETRPLNNPQSTTQTVFILVCIINKSRVCTYLFLKQLHSRLRTLQLISVPTHSIVDKPTQSSQLAYIHPASIAVYFCLPLPRRSAVSEAITGSSVSEHPAVKLCAFSTNFPHQTQLQGKLHAPSTKLTPQSMEFIHLLLPPRPYYLPCVTSR